MAKDEIVKAEPAEVVRPERPVPVEFEYAMAGTSFDDLAAEAITLPGHDLVKDDELDALVGVDFIITRVNFREGLPRQDSNPWKVQFGNATGAYVSLEITTNPLQILTNVNRARKASGLPPIHEAYDLGFEPGASLVINDGSTGIYRDIVRFLAMTGYIDIPEGSLEGGSGATALDTIPDEWPEVHVGEIRFTDTGFATYTANMRLRCKRGLRISEYQSEWNPDSKTRYLA